MAEHTDSDTANNRLRIFKVEGVEYVEHAQGSSVCATILHDFMVDWAKTRDDGVRVFEGATVDYYKNTMGDFPKPEIWYQRRAAVRVSTLGAFFAGDVFLWDRIPDAWRVAFLTRGIYPLARHSEHWWVRGEDLPPWMQEEPEAPEPVVAETSPSKQNAKGRKPSDERTQWRDKQIYEARKKGEDYTAIAERFGLSVAAAKDGYERERKRRGRKK